VSGADPNVSRLIQEYDTQSANASFEQPAPPLPTNPPPQQVLQQAVAKVKRLKSSGKTRPDVPAKPAVAAKPKTKVHSHSVRFAVCTL